MKPGNELGVGKTRTRSGDRRGTWMGEKRGLRGSADWGRVVPGDGKKWEKSAPKSERVVIGTETADRKRLKGPGQALS